MHKQLIKLLPKAKGESKLVIVVMADIRGFSKFSHSADAMYVATYISNIYIKLIELFSEIDDDIFYKTTGDGLLVTIPISKDDLKDKYNQVVDSCIKCHSNFASILDNVDLINFPIPDKIGFGISRGSACALVSHEGEDKFTIDFSGHKLNLAARLQDLARPSGVVLEGSKDINLLNEKLKNKFTDVEVFIKSVAEANPIKIWKTKTVDISPLNLRSLIGQWKRLEFKLTKSKFKKLPNRYHLPLEEGIIVESTVNVQILRPPITNKESADIVFRNLESDKEFTIYYEADKPKICLNIGTIKKEHDTFIEPISERTYVSFQIDYQVI